MILNGQNNEDLWKRQDMSPLRRFFLVVSVLLCILTILVFLYVLPCDTSSLCSPTLEPRTPISWDQTFEGVGNYLSYFFNRLNEAFMSLDQSVIS